MSDLRAPLSNADLKAAVRSVVHAQGNLFIKELLRKHQLKIGANKADFVANLSDAIDDGSLTQAMIEDWLAEVEGWGNQHVYLYAAPTLTREQLVARLAESPHAALLGQPIGYAFPDDLTLSAVVVADDHLSMSWHRGNEAWTRVKSKDFVRGEEDGETYKYEAYRLRSERSVVRFEWRFADPFCAVLIQLPREGEEHADAFKLVLADLRAAAIVDAAPVRTNLSKAFKALNHENRTEIEKVRMLTDGGYVELGSTLPEGGIEAVEAVRDTRNGMDDESFPTANPLAIFKTGQYALSRDIKIQGYGLDSRFKIWVGCKREDVYQLIDAIWALNHP